MGQEEKSLQGLEIKKGQAGNNEPVEHRTALCGARTFNTFLDSLEKGGTGELVELADTSELFEPGKMKPDWTAAEGLHKTKRLDKETNEIQYS